MAEKPILVRDNKFLIALKPLQRFFLIIYSYNMCFRFYKYVASKP